MRPEIQGDPARPAGPAAAGAPTGPGPCEGIGLAAFNAMPAAQARDVLLACCRAPRWADAVAAGRPYPSMGGLLARAAAVLTDADVAGALAGHPRIGEPAAGASGPADAMSRREQAGVTGVGD